MGTAHTKQPSPAVTRGDHMPLPAPALPPTRPIQALPWAFALGAPLPPGRPAQCGQVTPALRRAWVPGSATSAGLPTPLRRNEAHKTSSMV